MPTCPACSADIAIADVNIAEGVAVCRSCDSVVRLAEVAGAGSRAAEDAAAAGPPPDGCWFENDGRERRLRCAVRSPIATFFVAGSAWMGLVFVAYLTGIILGAVQTARGTPFAALMIDGQSVLPQSWSSILMMCVPLMMIVFLFAATTIIAAFLRRGRVEVLLRADQGEIHTGVGRAVWKRGFSTDGVRSVDLVDANSTANGRRLNCLQISGISGDIKLGTPLTDERQRWLAGMLRAELLR